MKLNWTAIGAGIGLLIVVIGWAWSIEHRLSKATDVSNRLKTIEEALLPVLIDFKINQLIGVNQRHNHNPEPARFYGSPPEPLPIPSLPVPPIAIDEPDIYPAPRSDDAELSPGPWRRDPMEDIHQQAEGWAREQLSLE